MLAIYSIQLYYQNHKRKHISEGGICLMSYKQLKQRTEGFTIIEVLIVLAIAGLIMLIVFLAIPALRRNQQNNTMRSEASRVLSAATEFEANANGVLVDDTTVGALYDTTFPTGSVAKELTTPTTFEVDGSPGDTEGASNLVVGTCSGTTASHVDGARTYALEFVLKGKQHSCIQS